MTRPAVRVTVRRAGVWGHPWVAYCTDTRCGPRTHIGSDSGGLGVNTRIGNRNHALAVEAALVHLERAHGIPSRR